MARRANLNLEGVRIGFRNFEGREGRYNVAGNRNFVIFLDNERAAELESQGWNIHWPKPTDSSVNEPIRRNSKKIVEQDNGIANGGPATQRTYIQTYSDHERNPFLKVRVNFNWKGLKIVMIVNGKPEFLDEDNVGVLDTADLENVDVSISPYEYEPGKISASLASMYATVRTDEFMAKYGY